LKRVKSKTRKGGNERKEREGERKGERNLHHEKGLHEHLGLNGINMKDLALLEGKAKDASDAQAGKGILDSRDQELLLLVLLHLLFLLAVCHLWVACFFCLCGLRFLRDFSFFFFFFFFFFLFASCSLLLAPYFLLLRFLEVFCRIFLRFYLCPRKIIARVFFLLLILPHGFYFLRILFLFFFSFSFSFSFSF